MGEVKAYAVVFYFECNGPAGLMEPNADPLRLGVPEAVVQLLLGDAVQALFDFGRQSDVVQGANQVGREDETALQDRDDQQPVEIGDAVVLFGEGLPVEEVAEKAGTIPYELLVGIGHRVPRVVRE